MALLDDYKKQVKENLGLPADEISNIPSETNEIPSGEGTDSSPTTFTFEQMNMIKEMLAQAISERESDVGIKEEEIGTGADAEIGAGDGAEGDIMSEGEASDTVIYEVLSHCREQVNICEDKVVKEKWRKFYETLYELRKKILEKMMENTQQVAHTPDQTKI